MEVKAPSKNRAENFTVMKLIYKTIATLGIATLFGGFTHAVPAQAGLTGTPLSAPVQTGGSIPQGRFYYPGGGNFYRGYLNNEGNGNYQGSIYSPSGRIYQGTFYYPNSGGNFHGLFYNPGSGRVIQGNFYNPGPGSINQNNNAYYAPLQGGIPYYYPVPGNSSVGAYNPSFGCYDERILHDWGVGCFSQRDYKKAIAFYTQALQKNPQLVDAYNKRALARFVLGDQQGTLADLRKAASLYLAHGDQNSYQQTLETIREVQAERTGGTNIRSR